MIIRLTVALLLAFVMAGPAEAQEDERRNETAAERACDTQCRVRKLVDGELTPQVLVAPDGRPRLYWLYEPSGLPTDEPVPLVVVLHGGGGDGLMYADWTGFDALAEQEGFVVAYPEGWGRTWNARTCCFLAWRTNVDDVGFMNSLVDHVSSRRAVDPGRVYATGHSNGAMLSHILACQSPRFVAAAAVAGTMGPPCDPQQPVSLLHIHGTADNNAPYEGGQGSDGLTATEHYPVRAVIDEWRARNQCPDPVVEVAGAVTSEISEGCSSGTAVGLYTIEGGGHPWPGSDGDSLRGTRPSQALDASLVAWEFFAAHPRSGG